MRGSGGPRRLLQSGTLGGSTIMMQLVHAGFYTASGARATAQRRGEQDSICLPPAG